jgi:RNA polymerase sigma-70 factor (ECF subfamily)
VQDEAEFVRAARAGDRDAFGRLVESYQRPVFSLAYRMLGSALEAEDAAQEAFLRAYRALGSYDASRPFSTWLLSITAHHCIDRIRRRRMQEVSLEALPACRAELSLDGNPEATAERDGEAERVRCGLASLPEGYRVVVVLRYWHDLGYGEIAGILGESESAVKSRLHRARRRLAEFLPEAAPAASGAPGAPGGPGAAADDGRHGDGQARAEEESTPCNATLPAS